MYLFIPVLEVRLTQEPSAAMEEVLSPPSCLAAVCAQLRVSALGRKGPRQWQPFVKQCLLAMAGVTDAHFLVLPSRRSHSSGETERLAFHVSR